jgi:hypothetical protein
VLLVRSPQFDGNRHFFAPLKNLPQGLAPAIAIEQLDPHTLRVTLTATNYVFGVRLLSAHAASEFSDNYIDLCAGESRSITVSNRVIALAPAHVTLGYGLSEGRE